MDTFYHWVVGDLGPDSNAEYPLIYWITLAVLFLVLATYAIIGLNKRISDHAKERILRVTAIFFVVFEIGWRVIFYLVKHSDPVSLYPMYPCNLGGVILPIICLTNWKWGKHLFYVFGFVGAALTFALPGDIFCKEILVFPVLKSVLQHTGLLIIPLFEYAMGKYRPSIKTFPFLFAGCLIHLFNCEVIDRLLGLTEDYMYLRSGLPFTIPGIPNYIVTSVFGLIVFAILLFLLNIKESVAFFRPKKKGN